MTASYTVDNRVTTVAAKGSPTLQIIEPTPGHLVVTGQIPAKFQGLVAEVKTVSDLGIPSTSVYPFDGAGSDDQGRSTPAAMATFLKRDSTRPTGASLFNALPVLDRSGTLDNTLEHEAVDGHAQIKTGNRIIGDAANQLLLLGNSPAGYVDRDF